MRTSSVFSSLAVSALISHTLGQSCGSQQNPSVNASDASASLDPFNLTAGPVKVGGADAATWTWTLATTSESASQGTSVEDRLWLDVQPPLDLTKPDFGYIGCGAILHGLTHETLLGGQNDDGSCRSVFSSDCIRALRNKTLEMAHEISSASTIIKPSNENSSASALCAFLEHLQPDDEPGLPAECAKSFNPGAWIETFVFASSQLDTLCSESPGSGNVTSPLVSWGHSTYSPADMTAYNNLTTLVTPMITIMLTNRSIDNNIPDIQFATQHLTCLRPNDISAGSSQPTEVPNTADGGGLGVKNGLVSLATLFAAIAFVL